MPCISFVYASYILCICFLYPLYMLPVSFVYASYMLCICFLYGGDMVGLWCDMLIKVVTFVSGDWIALMG